MTMQTSHVTTLCPRYLVNDDDEFHRETLSKRLKNRAVCGVTDWLRSMVDHEGLTSI